MPSLTFWIDHAQEGRDDVEGTQSADGGDIDDDDESEDGGSEAAIAAVEAAASPGPAVGLAGAGLGATGGTSSAGAGPSTGFVCTSCQVWNPRIVTGETAYAVTVGLQVGVFNDWYAFLSA